MRQCGVSSSIRLVQCSSAHRERRAAQVLERKPIVWYDTLAAQSSGCICQRNQLERGGIRCAAIAILISVAILVAVLLLQWPDFGF